MTETIASIQDILGADLDRISVERAVVGLFFTGVKLDTGVTGACAKARGMKRLSPETVSTYMTDAHKHFGKATKENTPNISEWHLDGQGNLTRTLENFATPCFCLSVNV